MFRWGKFIGAGGGELDWKIECDALDDEDWDCIARVATENIGHFNMVFGVPRGGLKLAGALHPYRVQSTNAWLIVDDVWTTGKSMGEFAAKIAPDGNWRGFVAFARGTLPANVQCFCKIGSMNELRRNWAKPAQLKTMDEKEIREALRLAYTERAELNRRIAELAEKLKAISPDYRKIMEQIEG